MDLYKYIKAHTTLNPKIWDGFKLRKDVEDKIQDIVSVFIEKINANDIPVIMRDIWLLGSNCSYNYNDNSDLDVHIMVDMKETGIDPVILNKVYLSYFSRFKEIYNPIIKGIPVEVYIEQYNGSNNASEGVYSLKDGWLKKPKKEDIEVNAKETEAKYDFYVGEFENLMERISHEDINYQIEEISKMIDDIYSLRTHGLSYKGEFSPENLTFKELRAKGYINTLRELKVKLENEKMTLK